MDFSGFSDYDRMRFLSMMEQKQARESYRIYNNLVERCFKDCVNDFTSRAVTPGQEKCVENCTDKFLKHTARVGQRFQEEQAAMEGGK